MGRRVSDGLEHQMRGEAGPSRPSVLNERRLAIDARRGEGAVPRSWAALIGASVHFSLG